MQSAQVKASVEAITERGQVTSRILPEVERMAGAGQAGFEIAENGVDPFELGYLVWLASGHDRGLVATTGLGDRPEAGQSIREYSAGWGKVVFRPCRNRLEGEAGHGRELDAQRASVLTERYRRDKRHLILRPPADFAASTLTAEVGIVHLHIPLKHIAIFTLGHHLQEFVVHQPRRRVAHPQLPLQGQGQGRQSRLGLADQIDRQEPDCQRQLGILKYGSRNQRSLMPARVALKNLAHAIAQNVMRRVIAVRTRKTARPAKGLKRLLALRFGSVVLQKVRHRQSRLKLNSIHRYFVALPLCNGGHFTVSQAHHMSLADVYC